MRFKIINTDGYNADGLDEKYQKRLEEFGEFVFVHDDKKRGFYIEINSIEDLEKLQKLSNFELIIDFRNDSLYDEPFIEIYDDYRE